VLRSPFGLACVFAASLFVAAQAQTTRSPARPSGPSLDASRLELIEPLVTEAIARRELPGAVVLAGRGNQILYKRAFGNRSVVPSTEPMTVDTIFDRISTIVNHILDEPMAEVHGAFRHVGKATYGRATGAIHDEVLLKKIAEILERAAVEIEGLSKG